MIGDWNIKENLFRTEDRIEFSTSRNKLVFNTAKTKMCIMEIFLLRSRHKTQSLRVLLQFKEHEFDLTVQRKVVVKNRNINGVLRSAYRYLTDV